MEAELARDQHRRLRDNCHIGDSQLCWQWLSDLRVAVSPLGRAKSPWGGVSESPWLFCAGTSIVFDMSLTYILVALAAVLLNNVVVERLNLHTRITTGIQKATLRCPLPEAPRSS